MWIVLKAFPWDMWKVLRALSLGHVDSTENFFLGSCGKYLELYHWDMWIVLRAFSLGHVDGTEAFFP